MDPIEVRLLGGIELKRHGRRIDLQTRSLQLLAYLLVKPGRSHPRERIAAELWPHADQDNARAYLRNALWQIRKALGSEFILSIRDSLSINTAVSLDLDVAKLEAQDSASLPIEELASRLSAFRGELLPNFYEEWVLAERARIASTADRLFKIITEKCLAQGRNEEAADWSEKWIYLLGPNEVAYRSLMKARAAMADLAGLTSAYQRCIDDLRRHLGVDPSSETRSLYHSLINGESDHAPSQPSDGSSSSRPASVRLNPKLLLTFGFISILFL